MWRRGGCRRNHGVALSEASDAAGSLVGCEGVEASAGAEPTEAATAVRGSALTHTHARPTLHRERKGCEARRMEDGAESNILARVVARCGRRTLRLIHAGRGSLRRGARRGHGGASTRSARDDAEHEQTHQKQRQGQRQRQKARGRGSIVTRSMVTRPVVDMLAFHPKPCTIHRCASTSKLPKADAAPPIPPFNDDPMLRKSR